MKLDTHHCLFPEWPAPNHVHALVTKRICGSFAEQITRNCLPQALGLKNQPKWLQQEHGTTVIDLDNNLSGFIGDASHTKNRHQVCAILTADCLPLLVTNAEGSQVAAIHAGWRGLLAGIIDATLNSLSIPSKNCLVWLGPAIGPDHFEVGSEVKQQFLQRHTDYSAGFSPGSQNHKWMADIYQLAKINLRHLGIDKIYGGGLCTYCEQTSFYSFRREKEKAGRMASLIWLSS